MARFLENTATDCWFIAFDIVGFSGFLDRPWALLHHRNNLIAAVQGTAFFSSHLVDHGRGRAQFLGDELRIAVPAGDVTSKLLLAHDFAAEVLRRLKAAAPSGAKSITAVRAAVARGTVRAESRDGWCRLMGPGVDALAALQELEGGEGRVISQRAVTGYDDFEGAYRSSILGDVASSGDGGHSTGAPDGEPTTFLALESAASDGQELTLTALRDVLSQWPAGQARPQLSITPRGALIAIAGDDFVLAGKMLRDIQARLQGMQAGLGVARGDRVDVDKWPWMWSNFESAGAVIACRIAAKVGPGRVGVDASVWNLAGSEYNTWPEEAVPGKRGEVFHCRVDPPRVDGAHGRPYLEDNDYRAAGPTAYEKLLSSVRAALAAAESLRRAWGLSAGLADATADAPSAEAVIDQVRRDGLVGVLRTAGRVARDARAQRRAGQVQEAAAIAEPLLAVLPALLAIAPAEPLLQGKVLTSLATASLHVAQRESVPMPFPKLDSHLKLDVQSERLFEMRAVLGLDPHGVRAATEVGQKMVDTVLPMLNPERQLTPAVLKQTRALLNRLRQAEAGDEQIVFAVAIRGTDSADLAAKVRSHMGELEAVVVVELLDDHPLAAEQAKHINQPLIVCLCDLQAAMGDSIQ